MAANTGAFFRFFKGWPEGVTGRRLSPATSERITTIFPAIYCRGMHSSAVSFSFSPRNEQVRQALSIMLSFSTRIGLGLPVEPEVWTRTVG